MLNYSTLDSGESSHVVYRCLVGSRVYGTHHANSDRDTRGLFVLPSTAYLGLEPVPNQLGDEKGDHVFYSLRRFFELLVQANPSMLELLFIPQEFVLYRHKLLDPVWRNRERLISKKVVDSFARYAQSQLKKARGQNKWVHNPWPEAPPQRLDYCWFLALDEQFKPLPLKNVGLDLQLCHAVQVSHSPGLYRIYHIGANAQGVFQDGQVVCHSVEPGQSLVGLLQVREDLFEIAKRDHRHYWLWRAKRNEARWRDQEQGLLDFDAKNVMHTLRLLLSCRHILQEGQPLITVDGPDLALLRSILAGEKSFADCLSLAKKLLQQCETLADSSGLPEQLDLHWVQSLLYEVTREWERLYVR
ncbi:MAG: nucleotidyltransferase domain-containing protein [Acidobacteria bacterium]|nr:nucleotidyltransferase domain-containing protein [Acidobacteriota bacterium]MCB9399391.1 nucleotidyltransferase domain-containing protein [Acidobacteriota bacterium]